MQCTELAAGHLSRFRHKKKPVASRFAEYKPSGLSRVGCNVGGLCANFKKTENNCRSQGSASGYLGQPATRTDRQGCEQHQSKRLKACVGAWSWRWTLQAFTVTIKSWHLIIGWLCCFNNVIELMLYLEHFNIKKSITSSFSILANFIWHLDVVHFIQ